MSGSDKPVFVNSNKFYNKNNNNNNNNNINSADNFKNTRPNFENKNKNYQNNNNKFNNNNSNLQRPKFFNNNPSEKKTEEVIENKYDIKSNIIYSNKNNNNINEKEEVTRILDLSTLLKNNQEENAKIKAPNRDYNEIDFNKPKYQTEKKRDEKVYLQKPQFKSSNRDANFVELDKENDVNYK